MKNFVVRLSRRINVAEERIKKWKDRSEDIQNVVQRNKIMKNTKEA